MRCNPGFGGAVSLSNFCTAFQQPAERPWVRSDAGAMKFSMFPNSGEEVLDEENGGGMFLARSRSCRDNVAGWVVRSFLQLGAKDRQFELGGVVDARHLGLDA